MAQRTSPELDELRQLWFDAVLFGGRVDVAGDYDGLRVEPCWFGENVPGIDSCEGRPEGAHWIKRQRVQKILASALWAFPHNQERGVAPRTELIPLAEWDPRNGVCACNKHHTRFDSQRMPTLTVWRHEVPAHVEAFALDWGLETALDDRNPVLGKGI